MADTDPLTAIKNTLRWLVIATVALYVGMVAAGGWVYWNAAQNKNALCALRGDLEMRVATSEAFLREHPDGVPGIPTKTIVDGIVNQRRTITALAGLSC